MNASSNPFALIGLLGNGLLSASVSGPGNLAQPSEGGEASFVDSLSAALATSLALPVPATADQAATGLGMFAASLAGGVAAGEGHLPTGDAALDPARLPLLPGAEPEMVEGLSKSLTPTLHRPAGPERPMQEMMPLLTVGKPSMLGEPAILGEGGAKAGTGSDIVENLQRQVGSRAVPLTAPSQTRMPGQPMTGASANEPSSSNAVAAPRPMPINSSQASAIAIASTTAPSTSANMPAGSVLPQQRPNLPRSADRPSAGGVDGNPVLQPVAERPAESAKPMSPVDHLRPSEQGIRNPLPNPSFGHQAQVQFTTDDVHLRPAKEQRHMASASVAKGTPSLLVDPASTPAVNVGTTSIVKGISAPNVENTPATASAKPTALAALATVDPVEMMDGATRPNTSAVEAFSTETASLDPAGATTSKSSVQPAQPPSAQIAMHIARAVPQGVDRFSIQLHPVDLGMVEIRLEFAEEGRVSALITVERQETLDMLQRDSRSLERTLNNAGLSLENGGLSFSLKQEQQQEQGSNASSHQQSSTSSSHHGRNGGGDEQPEQQPILVSPRRLLDIHT